MGLSDPISCSAGVNEVHIGLEVETECICQPFPPFNCLLFPKLHTQMKQSMQSQCLRAQSPPFLQDRCKRGWWSLWYSLSCPSFHVSTCWNVWSWSGWLNLLLWQKLGLLQIESIFFDLAWLAVQSSLMLKSMGLLDPDWQWNWRQRCVFS